MKKKRQEAEQTHQPSKIRIAVLVCLIIPPCLFWIIPQGLLALLIEFLGGNGSEYLHQKTDRLTNFFYDFAFSKNENETCSSQIPLPQRLRL
jgi:hypothetical protein